MEEKVGCQKMEDSSVLAVGSGNLGNSNAANSNRVLNQQ
jgi:hypothetical protein